MKKVWMKVESRRRLLVWWKHISQKFYTNMSLMLFSVSLVNVNLAKETHCTRWELKNSSLLGNVAKLYISPSEVVIYSILIFWVRTFDSDCNQFCNSLRLFDVWPNFPFTTSETMGDCYLQTWYVLVASRVAERIKT